MKPSHRTNSKTTQAFIVNGQITNQDAYSIGKPGPDSCQRCYYCQGENHISQFCPKNLNSEHQANNATNSAARSKDNQTPT